MHAQSCVYIYTVCEFCCNLIIHRVRMHAWGLGPSQYYLYTEHACIHWQGNTAMLKAMWDSRGITLSTAPTHGHSSTHTHMTHVHMQEVDTASRMSAQQGTCMHGNVGMRTCVRARIKHKYTLCGATINTCILSRNALCKC